MSATRSGTFSRIGRDRQIFVYAMLEPSVSAYHLAFATTASLRHRAHDVRLRRGAPDRSARRGQHFLSRTGPAAGTGVGCGRQSLRGGVVEWAARHREDHAGERQATLAVSGQNLVGLAFAPGGAAVLATTSGVHHLSWEIEGGSWFSSWRLAIGGWPVRRVRSHIYSGATFSLASGALPDLELVRESNP